MVLFLDKDEFQGIIDLILNKTIDHNFLESIPILQPWSHPLLKSQ